MQKSKIEKIVKLGNTLILGFGVSGKSVLKLISHGASHISIYVCEKDPAMISKQDIGLLESLNIPLLNENESLSIIDSGKINSLIVSPGIRLNHPVIEKSSKRNLNVIGELEFASTLLEGKIIGITGTNGKTTTVHLLNEIFINAGKKSVMCGNMGTAVSEIALNLGKTDFYIMEISSYQLELSRLLNLHGAIITNVTPDHCDRYASFDEYAKTKLIIESRIKSGGFFICQLEDLPLFKRLSSIAKSKPNWFPIGNRLGKKIPFYADNEGIWHNSDFGWDLVLEKKNIKLIGEHMYKNAAMAATASYLCGIELESILNTISRFTGLAHRIEWTGEINGVQFYNDSKATNLDAVLKALDTFAQPVILILGGRDKGADLTPLKNKIHKTVKTLILIGESSDYYEKFFCGCTKIIRSQNMYDAVSKGYNSADKGDVVLLSPACASFDMYNNFEHRGDDFKNSVSHLSCIEKI